eukprot:TRINITY_DN19856_c0_g1_i1.p2 TRINITY_DN19856_c0_g1~~TRINITY_DN19856_c0_g1_i1.p2  ORF type:complete len:256 (-),score=28.00 TRINITY_DN19856_c0_g1_i1:55-822(-)
MTTLRRFAPSGPLDAALPTVPHPPRETKPPKPPRDLRTPPQCQADQVRAGLRDFGGAAASSSSSGDGGRAPHFPPAPTADDAAGAHGYPPGARLKGSGSDANLRGAGDSPAVEDAEGSSRASSRAGPLQAFGRGSTASVASSSAGVGGAASSSASTRDPSPRPGSGASGASGRGRGTDRGVEQRGTYDGQLGAPVTWKSRPQDADTQLRMHGRGAGHLKGRSSNLAKIREIQGLPPRIAKSGPGSLRSAPEASAR